MTVAELLDIIGRGAPTEADVQALRARLQAFASLNAVPNLNALAAHNRARLEPRVIDADRARTAPVGSGEDSR